MQNRLVRDLQSYVVHYRSIHMYIIQVKQAGLELQYAHSKFKIPIISAYGKNLYISCCKLAAELLFLG